MVSQKSSRQRLRRFFEAFSVFQKKKPVGLYSVRVVSLAEELEYPEILPLELQFVLGKNSTRKEELQSILTNGKAVGVRTVEKTPERVLDAVNHISVLSQHSTVITWLPALLETQEEPQFTPHDLARAAKQQVDLYEEVRVILSHRLEFKKFVLVDEENRGISVHEQQFIRSLNEDIFPVAISHIVNRIRFDNAHTRTAVAQTIIKSLIFIGPIAHILEHYARGIGKVFTATVDDLMAETAELFALRGSGFTWRVLAKRGRILVPVFVLATYGAFQVEHFIQQDRHIIAGLLFGLSAVALSLTTAIQSIKLYLDSMSLLVKEKKLPVLTFGERVKLALRQDFTNPARLGLMVGAIASPLLAMTVFSLLPTWVHNGFVLAMLGSTESIVAGTTVILAGRINKLLFRRNLSRKIRSGADGRN